MDLSHYRLTDNDSWHETYTKSLGIIALDDYIKKVYSLLDVMLEKSFFDIFRKVDSKNWELFIKICCKYIDEVQEVNCKYDTGINYVFSNDFTIIKRNENYKLINKKIHNRGWYENSTRNN